MLDLECGSGELLAGLPRFPPLLVGAEGYAVWIVPGFTVERYRDRLRALHQQIQQNGPFVAHASRYLIEAVKPE